jgi:hypothetical protein
LSPKEIFLILYHGALSGGHYGEQAKTVAMEAYTNFVDACEEFEVDDK